LINSFTEEKKVDIIDISIKGGIAHEKIDFRPIDYIGVFFIVLRNKNRGACPAERQARTDFPG
jgi:hypothetical protein